ncbi:hypothetical protein JCM10914A_53490 [Paenibacillus sp. JCM 10914]
MGATFSRNAGSLTTWIVYMSVQFNISVMIAWVNIMEPTPSLGLRDSNQCMRHACFQYMHLILETYSLRLK